MLNLSIFLEDSARQKPDRVAVIAGDLRLTYRELDEAANRVANGLAQSGIGIGDKIALSCPNRADFPIIYYGILKTGATAVPLNVLLREREIAYHLEDSDAVAIFCFEGSPELPMGEWGRAAFEQVETCEHFFLIKAESSDASGSNGSETLHGLMNGQPSTFESVATEATDTAVIVYTSGTTGQPKGAELSHANLVMNAIIRTENLLPPDPHHVYLVVAPLFHTMGQSAQMNSCFYRGDTMILLPRFDAGDFLATMQNECVSVIGGAPTMYWALLNLADAGSYDLVTIRSHLKFAGAGGASLPRELLDGFRERFGVDILEGYGLTETSPFVSFSRRGRQTKVGSVGQPMWGVEVRVVDADDNDVPVGEVGEIVVRGHNVMKGYYKRPEATAEAMRGGWFHTGDLGRFDEDGYLYITDRLKEMIIRGGFNVYPREVEEVLMTHPAVSLVAVIGVPDERYGEEVKAFVILKEGTVATPEEIVAWSKQKMAAYKYPRLVEIRESLPMSATGKILKRALGNE